MPNGPVARGSTPTPSYRAGVIGLGWMGLLHDIAVGGDRGRYEVDDVDRPTPELDVHRRFHAHDGPGPQNVPHTWAQVLWDRPEVQLVAAAERDGTRLDAFGRRYHSESLYTDARDMLRNESLDIVAIATNTKGRADLTGLAVECGVKAIATEKPMAHRLDEADRMVQACGDAGVPLLCGATPLNHPAFAKAKQLLHDGAIGDLLSIEASAPKAQKQYWSYFVDDAPAWVVGHGDAPRRDTGSDEFAGQGVMVTTGGLAVHFRKGAPTLRLSGSAGEIVFGTPGLQLWQDIDTPGGTHRAQVPWPAPGLAPGYNAVYGLADLIACLEGRLDEPKNSGRRVAVALEVEIALKQSAANNAARIEMPLKDRALGMYYDWFR